MPRRPASQSIITEPSDSSEGDRERQPAPAQKAMIASWVALADDLGIPRSLAQIYGLLFTASQPLDAQGCADTLQISRSSAGQGLRALKDLGAIRSTFELGSRSEHFTIEPDLGVLVKNVLEGRLIPAFERFFQRQQNLAQEHKAELNPFLQERLEKLQRWKGKSQILPGILSEKQSAEHTDKHGKESI